MNIGTSLRPPRAMQWLFAVTIAIFFAISLRSFWPGMYSPDSYSQFSQAMDQIYENHHPVMMAWWWGFLYRYVFAHGAVLLIFHLLLFWGAIYILGTTVSRNAHPAWAFACIAIWLLPPNFGMTAALWKDTGMTCSWFLACALMLRATHTQKTLGDLEILTIALLLFYGTAVRHNALFGLPPLCYWFALSMLGKSEQCSRKAIVALLLCILLITAKVTFERAISIDSQPIYQENMLIDLTFVSQRMHTSLLPSYVLHDHNLSYQQFLQRYPITRYATWLSGDLGTTDPEKLTQLRKAYVDMVVHHPLEYLSARWWTFNNALRIGLDNTCSPFIWNTSLTPSWLHTQAGAYLTATKPYILSKPYPWLIAAFMLLIAARRMAPETPARAEITFLSLSSLMYVLPDFFLIPSCDFRNFYWLVIAICIALLLFIISFFGRTRLSLRRI